MLEESTVAIANRYRELATGLGYQVNIPDDVDPTWFIHLVIIYFKRGEPVTRVLDDAGYEAALRAKLLEEAHEVQAAPEGEEAFIVTARAMTDAEKKTFHRKAR